MSYRKAEWENTPNITLATEWSKIALEPVKPKRLRCQYCGRIAMTERPTCEGCGAVLPWEKSYEE